MELTKLSLRLISLASAFLATIAFAHGGHAPAVWGGSGDLPPGATVVRDAVGRLVRAEFDTDADGRVDVLNLYENGKLASQRTDTDRDGRLETTVWVDGNGEPVRGEIDATGDGTPDVAEWYADGYVVERRTDTNGDGRFDVVAVAVAGRVVRTEQDVDSDGRVDHWWFYDADGRETAALVDADGDGHPDPPDTRAESVEPEPSLLEAGEAIEADTDVVLGEETVRARRPLTSASDRDVRRKDFLSFPHQNPSDLVRLIPGVHVSQHTGGAKAYQYFLRGFDAEHGQDLAAYLDGIPLNEPSQVHGHGYLDLHFLVPETVENIRIIKGPYDPEFGNFATAGAIDFIPRRTGETHTVSATAGMFGTARALGTFHVESGPYFGVGALETDHTEGFTDPGWADAVRANQGHTVLVGDWALNLMSHHYAQRSAATDVIPEEWVEDGRLGRYDAVDDSDRVASNRHLVGATADWDRGTQNLRLQGWFDYKQTTIFSNYTFYLLHPDRGDQQQMRDSRRVVGVNARYTHVFELGPTFWDVAAGVQWRLDMVDQILANTRERKRFNVVNDLDFTESALGAWARVEFAPAAWVRIVPGVRFDVIQYQGDGTQDERYFNIYTNQADTRQDVPRDWNETASILSPKASVIFTRCAAGRST